MKQSTLVFSLSLTLTGQIAAQDAPNPDEVSISKITWAGNGCADSTAVGSNLSEDAKAFTLTFNSFYAEIGPTIPNGFSSSKCKVSIDLSFPSGWSYTLFSVDYRGYAILDENVVGTLSSDYYFQTQSNSAVNFTSQVPGEMDDYFYRQDTIGINEFNWSPCNKSRSLNIDSEVSVESDDDNAEGAFFIDSIDGELSHVYGIKWQRC